MAATTQHPIQTLVMKIKMLAISVLVLVSALFQLPCPMSLSPTCGLCLACYLAAIRGYWHVDVVPASLMSRVEDLRHKQVSANMFIIEIVGWGHVGRGLSNHKIAESRQQ